MKLQYQCRSIRPTATLKACSVEYVAYHKFDVERTRLTADELITSISIPVANGTQEFLKVGKRNAMVIAVANLAFACSPERRHVACALGAVGPTVVRCTDAETFIRERIDWGRRRVRNRGDLARFGEMCSAAAMPIDDHRSTSRYRLHAISVMSQRAAARAY